LPARRLFGGVLVVWSLFVFWCLEFVILDTKLLGRADKL
jgi:hypothetical protein